MEGIIQQDAVMGDDGAREIVSLDPPDAPYLKELPMTVHAMGVAPFAELRKGRLEGFGYSPRLIPWLKKNIGAYDCAIVNGLWNYAAVGASRVLPGGDTPYFVFSHGMMDPWFRKAYPLKHHVKQLSWLLFEGRLASHAQALLFTTEEERTQAEGVFTGHPYRGDVVRYGTSAPTGDAAEDVQAFHLACPTLEHRPYLLFLSRIHAKKGCDLLMTAFGEAASSATDLQLVMAGPDQSGWTRDLKAEADRLGVSGRVHWPGMLRGEAKWGAFRGAEAFVLPSHQENFGIVVAESLACGTPVLISNKVNIWREVSAAGAGYVEADDAAGTMALLRRWINTSPSVRADMRQRARVAFETHFEVRASAHEMLVKMSNAVKCPV